MLQLTVNVKQLGKRKDAIQSKLITLEQIPFTTAELIKEVVVSEVNEFHNRLEESKLIRYLTVNDIQIKSIEGKVSLGLDYNKNLVETNEAVHNALQSFEDGIFRIFIGENELTSLNEAIALTDNDKLTFIRLTMLAGRMW